MKTALLMVPVVILIAGLACGSDSSDRGNICFFTCEGSGSGGRGSGCINPFGWDVSPNISESECRQFAEQLCYDGCDDPGCHWSVGKFEYQAGDLWCADNPPDWYN